MPTTDRWLQLKQLFLFFSGIFSPILALVLGAVSMCVAGDLGHLLAPWRRDDGRGFSLRGRRRAAGSAVSSTPPQQQETSKKSNSFKV